VGPVGIHKIPRNHLLVPPTLLCSLACHTVS
jgi:hypothetical protein